MGRLRVGFRGFLLIITLASLVVATYAIRARTDAFRSAQDHDLLAHQLRVRLAGNYAHKEDWRLLWEWKTPPFVSHEWAAGCNLQVLPPVRSVEEFPARGKDLIVVGDFYGVLRIRIFDGAGKIIVDISEGETKNGAHDQRVNDLKHQIVKVGPPHEITEAEKAQVIAAAASIVNSCRSLLLAEKRFQEAEAKAQHEKAVAELEHHERLARSYRP
jgi:hypothetical protein